MVLLFRFIKTLIVTRLSRRIGPLEEGRVSMRVWPNDLDLNMHANSGRYISFIDVGRVNLLVGMRIFRKVLRMGWRPLVGGSMTTYRRPLLPFERFTVRSRIVAWDEKWLYFEHIVENAKGEMAAKSTVRGLLRGPKGNVPPGELLAVAGLDLASPPLPVHIAKWRDAEASG